MYSFNKRDHETGVHGFVESVHGHKRRQASRSRPSNTHWSDTKTYTQQGDCSNCYKPGHRMGDCPGMKKPGLNGKQTTFTAKSKLTKPDKTPAKDKRSSGTKKDGTTSDKAKSQPEHIPVDTVVVKSAISEQGDHPIRE